ncbi:MAG: nascent polypeptide-associated complex protein [Methanosarcina mazei]|nr:nascent polypeptide-associated complex protein [Methanosarcina mazei]
MFPGMGGVGGRGMNPAKMKQMMKQMGIDVKELKDVEEVVIKTADSNIVIENANVTIMTVQGSETYQIVGDVKEVPKSLEIPAEDIKLVMEQTGVSEEEARKALKNSDGGLAEAILALSSA